MGGARARGWQGLGPAQAGRRSKLERVLKRGTPYGDGPKLALVEKLSLWDFRLWLLRTETESLER